MRYSDHFIHFAPSKSVFDRKVIKYVRVSGYKRDREAFQEIDANAVYYVFANKF